jgi:hypothetical protein
MMAYAQNHGFSIAEANTIQGTTFGQWKSYLDLRPVLVTFTNQTYYSPQGGHTVNGVGYKEYFYSGSSNGHQYLIIHDNWSNTPENVYLAYGRNYDTIYLHHIKLN